MPNKDLIKKRFGLIEYGFVSKTCKPYKLAGPSIYRFVFLSRNIVNILRVIIKERGGYLPTAYSYQHGGNTSK